MNTNAFRSMKMFAATAVAASLVFAAGCSDNDEEQRDGFPSDGDERITSPPHLIFGSLTDTRDNKTYRTVIMPDGKEWMMTNLNYAVNDGNGSWCYGNDADNCERYGRLYDWHTAMNGAESSKRNPSGVQGICPNGWYLPSMIEWTVLTDSIGGASTASGKLKSTDGWDDNGNGTNEFGFSALPGGYRLSTGNFYHVGRYGYWWTASEDANDIFAYCKRIYYGDNSVDLRQSTKNEGYSIRCVRSR